MIPRLFYQSFLIQILFINRQRRNVTHYFWKAALIIVSTDKACTSILRRRFNIGYTQANLLMNQLEKAGIIGSPNGGNPRKVLKPVNQKGKSQQISFKRLIDLFR